MTTAITDFQDTLDKLANGQNLAAHVTLNYQYIKNATGFFLNGGNSSALKAEEIQNIAHSIATIEESLQRKPDSNLQDLVNYINDKFQDNKLYLSTKGAERTRQAFVVLQLSGVDNTFYHTYYTPATSQYLLSQTRKAISAVNDPELETNRAIALIDLDLNFLGAARVTRSRDGYEVTFKGGYEAAKEFSDHIVKAAAHIGTDTPMTINAGKVFVRNVESGGPLDHILGSAAERSKAIVQKL